MPKQESPVCLLPARQLPPAVERIHFDQCMPTRLARFLRQHGLNVTTTAEAGLNDVKDHAQLDYARSRRRLLITKDQGFRRYHRRAVPHRGILLCREDATEEEILTFIRDLAAKSAEEGNGHVAEPEQESSICLLPARKFPLALDRIHLDKCIPKRLAGLLRRHGLNVTTAATARMNGVKDHAHLNYARFRCRLLITTNPGFRQYDRGPVPHHGILLCPEDVTDEEILAFIRDLAAKSAEEGNGHVAERHE
jgi:predicted nuclease of predicted toxin-antitoxin system